MGWRQAGSQLTLPRYQQGEYIFIPCTSDSGSGCIAERSRQADMIWCLLHMVAVYSSPRIRELEAKLNEDSSTSNQPSSGNFPYDGPARKSQKQSGNKWGGQPGHQGQRQELLETTEERHVRLLKCRCGPALSFLSAGLSGDYRDNRETMNDSAGSFCICISP